MPERGVAGSREENLPELHDTGRQHGDKGRLPASAGDLAAAMHESPAAGCLNFKGDGRFDERCKLEAQVEERRRYVVQCAACQSVEKLDNPILESRHPSLSIGAERGADGFAGVMQRSQAPSGQPDRQTALQAQEIRANGRDEDRKSVV